MLDSVHPVVPCTVDNRLLGRMNATMRFVVWGVLPVGALLGGMLGAALGLRTTLWIGALGQALAGIWLLASPMRNLRDFPDAPPESGRNAGV